MQVGGKRKSLSRNFSRKTREVIRFFLPVPTDGGQAQYQVRVLQSIDQRQHSKAYRDRQQDHFLLPTTLVIRKLNDFFFGFSAFTRQKFTGLDDLLYTSLP